MRTFSVKFPDDQAAYIEVLAAERGQSLSAFIREQVMAKDHLHHLLVQMQSGLHAAIDEGFRQRHQTDKTMPGQDGHTALLLEIVLRMRAGSNPTATTAVFAEMKRLGVTPFTT